MHIMLAEGDDLAAVVRAANAGSIVLQIGSHWSPLALALAKASIGPLAVERAPAARVNAIVVGVAADAAEVDSAIAFLERAVSTTGQLLEVS